MKVLKLALCAAAASFAMASAASAQDVSFNVGVTSDYVFRGFTQTMEDPAVFGGVDVSHGLFYAGAWASNVDFGDETDAEIDVYAGVKPTFEDVTFDFGAVYYGYVNAPSGSDYGYWEFKAAASVPLGPVTAGAVAYYSPEFFGGIGDAFYYEGNVSISPVENLSLSAAVGNQSFDIGGDYMTWNLGGGYTFADKFTLDLRYHDTDIKGCTNLCDERYVATLKAAF